METWLTLKRDFPTREKALQAAGILEIAETRLANSGQGPQYDIETEVFEMEDKWRVKWRKVFAGFKSGCGSCGSCNVSDPTPKTESKPGKVLEFKRK